MQSNKSEYEEIVQPKRQKEAARLTSIERRSRGKCPAKCQRGRQTREQLKGDRSAQAPKGAARLTSTGRRIEGGARLKQNKEEPDTAEPRRDIDRQGEP